MLMQGIPTGEESDADSFDEPADSEDEWDKTKCGNWSHCSSLPTGQRIPHGQRLLQNHEERSSGERTIPHGKRHLATPHIRIH